MRELFHGELRRLGAELASTCALVSLAIERATRALLETDRDLAEQVIDEDRAIDRLAAGCDEHACRLLALQAPVATDLRTVITAIRVAEKIERMGDLARHVAEIARLRHPRPAVPAELAGRFAEMGRLALSTCRYLEHAIATTPAVGGHVDPERVDDDVDRLHRELLTAVSHAQPAYSIQVGVDVALLARYYERFADQAVNITRRLDYIQTGEMLRHPS